MLVCSVYVETQPLLVLAPEVARSLRSTVREFYKNWRSGAYDEERLSSQAGRCVIENYSFGSMLRRYENMFEDVIRNHT